MSKENAETAPWATLTLRAPNSSGGENDSGLVDLLDALGAMLAEHPGVGGVETRDPALFGASVEAPELVVYTTPPHVEELELRARQRGAAMGLELDVHAQVRTDDDWRDSWKNFYTHIILGEGDLLLRPSWLERREGDPERELVLDPGRAFGTGYHQSTRLCLELLMQRAREGFAPAAVLDLGCGSGILGIAWAKRAAAQSELVFVDIDPEAVDTARENVEINALLERSRFAVGGAGALDERFALVIANIRPEVLDPFAEAIVEHVAPGGELLLSGILNEEGDRLVARYTALGLELLGRPELEDWCALWWRRPETQ